MKTTALLSVALLSSIALSSCVITTSDGDSSFRMENRSSYAIYEAYITPVGAPSWGPDLLGGTALLPGEDLVIYDLDCDTYDALIYDELGATCELNNIRLCFDDSAWIIDNALLSTCPIFR